MCDAGKPSEMETMDCMAAEVSQVSFLIMTNEGQMKTSDVIKTKYLFSAQLTNFLLNLVCAFFLERILLTDAQCSRDHSWCFLVSLAHGSIWGSKDAMVFLWPCLRAHLGYVGDAQGGSGPTGWHSLKFQGLCGAKDQSGSQTPTICTFICGLCTQSLKACFH